MKWLAVLGVVFLVSLSVPVSARKAARKGKHATPAPVASSGSLPDPSTVESDQSSPAPQPGSCLSIQAGLKVCSTIDGRGSFDVTTIPPALVLVSFEDPVTWVNPPPKEYFRADLRENTVTIAPTQRGFPDPTPVVITAGGTVVTLNLRPGSGTGKVDTQVIIKDPARGVRDAEIDARVAERLEPRLKDLAERERGLEKRADERARALILDEIARAGVDLQDLGAVARNDAFIVLRAKSTLRIGKKHYVIVSVENRSPQPFEIKGARAWASEGDAERELVVSARFASTVVATGEEVLGAMEVPFSRVTATTRIRVRVEEAHPSRAVELGGLRAR